MPTKRATRLCGACTTMNRSGHLALGSSKLQKSGLTMRKHSIDSGWVVAALLALTPVASGASAAPPVRASGPRQLPVERAAFRRHVHHHRPGVPQQPGPRDAGREPTGGGDYGGPASAFPVGENSAVRPGGSYAITAPLGSPAYAIQQEQQRRFCRDNPEAC